MAAAADDTALDLSGAWRVRLDPDGVGASERWFAATLGAETMALPGTTDLARKGLRLDRERMRYAADVDWNSWPASPAPARIDEAGHLVREWLWIGKAWYQRDVTIPASWRGRFVRLRLERVVWGTSVWIDDRYVGSGDSLVTEHRFDLGVLVPGTHRLTVRVDNGPQLPIGTLGHGYGPETQSRWNGIVGELELVATQRAFVESLRALPAADRRSIRVEVVVRNTTGAVVAGDVRLRVRDQAGRELVHANRAVSVRPGRQIVKLDARLATPAAPWDEFHTPRYEAVAAFVPSGSNAAVGDELSQRFGFRHIARSGRRIEINGRTVFLRGTLDCCVFPRTGHPPMTVAAWRRILSTAQRHGFNHVRFHTWCPPDAAFEAADELGVYLEPETAFWVDNWTHTLGSKPPLLGQDAKVTDWVRREIRRIQHAYGHHPSFVLLSIGNEFGMSSDWELIDRLVAEAKARDRRHLASGTTARKRTPSDEFWVTHAVHGKGVRGIGPPHTNWDFAAGVGAVDLPVVSHETGQMPVFPDYSTLLPKFTGPLQPLNYERLRRQLDAWGLLDQQRDFARASARFQLVEYKAEHEGLLRTREMAGYQLLMLTDFSGQSEALVGILDPFGEPKGFVTAEEVRRWNAPTVPLARFERFTWTADDVFRSDLEVAHFGPEDLVDTDVRWRLVTAGGTTVASGALPSRNIPTGEVTRCGAIAVPLASVGEPTALTLSVAVGKHENRWSLWCYPAVRDVDRSADAFRGALVAKHFDGEVQRELAAGGRVVLLVHGLANAQVGRTSFRSVYWSAGWWGNRFSTLGIVCDPRHPALARFPNDGHSDWQWYRLTQGATTIVLDDAPQGFRPIVQPVTDFHHTRRLAHVFEARVGKGKLLVCGYDLSDAGAKHSAVRQLRRSLAEYVKSDAFTPRHELSVAYLEDLLGELPMRRLGARVRSADSDAPSYEAANAIDGRPETFWHTPWTGAVPRFPHEIVVELAAPVRMRGVRTLARQDGNPGGRLQRCAIDVSSDGSDWTRAATTELKDGLEWQEIPFAAPASAKFLRFVALSSHEGKDWASLAELEVLRVVARE